MKRRRIVLLRLGLAVATSLGALFLLIWWLRAPRSAADASASPKPAAEAATTDPIQTVDIARRPMPWLPAGIAIGEQTPQGWSHLILHATPRVADGDQERVSPAVARLAAMFHLVVLARTNEQGPPHRPNYALESVAIGLASQLAGQEVTVASGDASPTGLDFMERTALSQNEASLKTSRQIARTETMIVFDADTIMLYDGEHQRMIHRYAILVSPSDGQVAALVWALKPLTATRRQVCGDALHWRGITESCG